MKVEACIVINLIFLSSSLSESAKNSWEDESLPDNMKKYIQLVAKVNYNEARNWENDLKKEKHDLKKQIKIKDQEIKIKDQEIKIKDQEIKIKDQEIKIKDQEIKIIDQEIEESKSKETFQNFICASITIKAHIKYAWGTNTTDGVSNVSVKNYTYLYYSEYKSVKRGGPCKVYEFLQYGEQFKLPKEKNEYYKSFIKGFIKWLRYMRFQMTPLSKRIMFELMNSPLYQQDIYQGCDSQDYVIDFIFSMNKLHLLTNLINYELIKKFSLINENTRTKDKTNEFMNLLNEEMRSRGVSKWYFPYRYLVHANILLKAFNSKPLQYALISNMDEILPQSSDCPRQSLRLPSTDLTLATSTTSKLST